MLETVGEGSKRVSNLLNQNRYYPLFWIFVSLRFGFSTFVPLGLCSGLLVGRVSVIPPKSDRVTEGEGSEMTIYERRWFR